MQSSRRPASRCAICRSRIRRRCSLRAMTQATVRPPGRADRGSAMRCGDLAIADAAGAALRRVRDRRRRDSGAARGRGRRSSAGTRARRRARCGELRAVPCRAGSGDPLRRRCRAAARRRRRAGCTIAQLRLRVVDNMRVNPRNDHAELLQGRRASCSVARALRRQADPVRARGRGHRRVAGNAAMMPRGAQARSSRARAGVCFRARARWRSITCLPARAADGALPVIPALTTFLAGRTPRCERVQLDLPQLADNGLSVPMRSALPVPSRPGRSCASVALFSETQPGAGHGGVRISAAARSHRDRIAHPARRHAAHRRRRRDERRQRCTPRRPKSIVTLGGCMDGTRLTARRPHHRPRSRPARQAVRGAHPDPASRWRPAIAPTTSGKSIPRNVIRTLTCRYNGDPCSPRT